MGLFSSTGGTHCLSGVYSLSVEKGLLKSQSNVFAPGMLAEKPTRDGSGEADIVLL